MLLARSAGLLETLRAELAAGGTQALVTVADVADAAAVDRAFEAATQEFGGVDVVVHTAAVIAYGRHDQVPPDVTLSVGLTATVQIDRAPPSPP